MTIVHFGLHFSYIYIQCSSFLPRLHPSFVFPFFWYVEIHTMTHGVMHPTMATQYRYNFISFISIHTMIYVAYTAYEKSAIEITMKPGWYITLWHFNIQQIRPSPIPLPPSPASPKAFQQNHTFVLLRIKLTCWRLSISIEFNANVLNTHTHTHSLKHIQMRAEHSFCVYKRLKLDCFTAFWTVF